MTKKTKILWAFSLFLTLFVGLGAIFGGACMLLDPLGGSTGMDGLLPGLRKLPFADVLFQDLTFSGIALLIVNGLTQLATAVMLWVRKPNAPKCALGCGVILMLWITIQFFIFPLNVLSVAYFVFGLLEVGLGAALLRAGRG